MIRIQIVIYLIINRDQMVIIRIFKDFQMTLIHLIFLTCFLRDSLINKFIDNITQVIIKDKDKDINNNNDNNSNKIHTVY